MRAYAAALDGTKTRPSPNIGAARTIPGTLNALIARYYRSAEFIGLAPSTRSDRRRILEHLREKHGSNPIARLERKHIRSMITAKAHVPHAANQLLKFLRIILAYAVEEDMLPTNPALGIKKFKTKNPDGIHCWSEDEVTLFENRHPLGTKARLVLALTLYTGQRRSDVAKMGWQHIQGEAIAVRQKKTNTPLLIPLHPNLKRVLAETPRSNLTIILSEFGQPFSDKGLGKFFRKCCDAAGLPKECSLHGLRKLAATRLADLGCSVHQIMAITGHHSVSQLMPYVRRADQKRLAEQAMSAQLAVSGTGTEIVQPTSQVDKQRRKPNKINIDSSG